MRHYFKVILSFYSEWIYVLIVLTVKSIKNEYVKNEINDEPI